MTAKEPFEYEYTMPSLDWFTSYHVTINWNDYNSFELQRRYGSDFELWLIGYKTVDDGRHIQLKKTELGYLTPYYIKAFLDWCEFDFWGKKANIITSISVISADINLFKVIDEIIKLREKQK